MTEAVARERSSLPYLVGFGLLCAFLGGADGYLIGEGAVAPTVVGALAGAFIGAGLVLLAFRRWPADARTERAAPHHESRYFLVWGGLFALTIVEVGVAFLALPKIYIILALILVAVWKAVMVALYYMHLKFEPRRLVMLAVSPLPLAVILVLAVLTEY